MRERADHMKSWEGTFQEEKVMFSNTERTVVCQRNMSRKDRKELDDAGLGRPWRRVGFPYK